MSKSDAGRDTSLDVLPVNSSDAPTPSDHNQIAQHLEPDKLLSISRKILDVQDWALKLRLCRSFAMMLQGQFQLQGHLAYLEDAITLHRTAFALEVEFDLDQAASLNNLGTALFTRFQKKGSLIDLDEAISLHREVLLTPGPARSVSIDNLATALYTRFQQGGQHVDLEEAISLLRETLTFANMPTLRRPTLLNNLSAALQTQFRQKGQLVDLEEAIGLHRQALTLEDASHPNRSILLNNLALALSTQFEHKRQIGDLEEAISLHRESVTLQDTSPLEQWARLNALALVLVTRFQEKGQQVDLDDAIAFHQEALDLQAASHPDCWTSLNNLGVALHARFEHQGKLVDLDKEITLFREALALCVAPHPNRWMSLNHLALALRVQFSQKGQLVDLEETTMLYQEALALQNSPQSLNNLAMALHTGFEHKGQLADLKEAISLHRKALTLKEASHHDQLTSLSNLSLSLWTKFHHLGQFSDLEEGISLQHRALALQSASQLTHPAQWQWSMFNNLATALCTQFSQRGLLEDLEEAITIHYKALSLQVTPHLYRICQSTSLNNVALALQLRFRHKGKLDDLNKAISLHREALDLQDTLHPGWITCLNNLAAALQTQFGETGQYANLDEAILLQREALASPKTWHLHQRTMFNNLATSLTTRFQHSGQTVDMDEAILLCRKALTSHNTSYPDRPYSLTNLATSLAMRYEHKGASALKELDQAILLHNEGLILLDVKNPSRWNLLNNFALALRTQFKQEGKLAMLEDAISLHREALTLQNTPHSAQSTSLCHLANALIIRFGKTYQLADIDEAIELSQQAHQVLPRDHPAKCDVFTTLGMCFQIRFYWIRAHLGDKVSEFAGDLNSAIEAFHVAADCESALVSQRFGASRLWITSSEVSDSNDEETLGAYQTAIGLLPRLVMLHLDLKSRRQAMSLDTDGLARDAATCAIQSQKIHKAIELLEAGRAIFWSQALQLRTPLEDLESVKPDLAQKLKDISHALERGSFRDISRTVSDPLEKVISAEKEASFYRDLNAEWLQTVQKVREEVHGFHDFLRPKSFAALSAAAANGPVVILIAGGLRSQCDALVMRSSQEPVHVPLLKFTQETLQGLVRMIQSLSTASIPRVRGDRTMLRVPLDGKTPDSTFRDVLSTLWTSVVQPILKFLKLEKSDSPPRLWWLPTGPFASLPIHAAGVYDTKESECVGDYVISSYTPTLSALLASPSTTAEPFKMLAAIQPVTAGHRSLPCTRDELCRIEEHVRSRELVKLGIPDAPAYVKDVLAEFKGASIVHLACHGVQDTKNPLDSALILEDGRLRISQIIPLSLSNASLVFLSACQTAMVDNKLPDESINLAATLLFAGFRGAVGTMWSIEDCDGPEVANSFYRHLFSSSARTVANTPPGPPDTTRAAEALHLAITELRNKLHAEKCPSPFLRWVPFIHMGL